MSDTIYLQGSIAKARKTSFGEVINISLNVPKLAEFCKAHKNEKGYVNIQVVPRKAVGQFGDTHSIKLDTWKPDPDKAKDKTAATTRTARKPKDDPFSSGADAGADVDDLPF